MQAFLIIAYASEHRGRKGEGKGEERGPNHKQPASSGGCSRGTPPRARHKLKRANRQQQKLAGGKPPTAVAGGNRQQL